MPTGGFRDHIRFGIGGRWDDGAGGDGPNFNFNGETTATTSPPQYDPCPGSQSKVFVRENLGASLGQGDETFLGLTRLCRFNAPGGSSIIQFLIVFELTAELDGAVGWYTGDAAPPANRWDLKSIAAHEAGHATGFFGHFSFPCPNNADPDIFETMCNYNPNIQGTNTLRTLEEHDLHTYENAY